MWLSPDLQSLTVSNFIFSLNNLFLLLCANLELCIHLYFDVCVNSLFLSGCKSHVNRDSLSLLSWASGHLASFWHVGYKYLLREGKFRVIVLPTWHAFSLHGLGSAMLAEGLWGARDREGLRSERGKKSQPPPSSSVLPLDQDQIISGDSVRQSRQGSASKRIFLNSSSWQGEDLHTWHPSCDSRILSVYLDCGWVITVPWVHVNMELNCSQFVWLCVCLQGFWNHRLGQEKIGCINQGFITCCLKSKTARRCVVLACSVVYSENIDECPVPGFTYYSWFCSLVLSMWSESN